MNSSILFEKLSSICKNHSDAEEEAAPNHPETSEIWTSLFEVAKSDPNHFNVFSPLACQFFIFQNYKVDETEAVSNGISEFINSENIGKKKELLSQIILFLPFISSSFYQKIFEAVVLIIGNELNENGDVNEILKVLNYASGSLPDEAVETLKQTFQNSNEKNEKLSETLLLISPFANNIIEMDNDLAYTIMDTISKAVDGNNKSQIFAALKLLVNIVDIVIDINKKVATKFFNELFEKLIKIIENEDKSIEVIGFKAMKKLIDGVYNNKQCLKIIINLLMKEEKQDKQLLYFKFIQKYMDSENLSIIQIIYEFVSNAFMQPTEFSTFWKAQCIELLSEIASLQNSYLNEIYQQAFDFSIELLNENKYLTEITNLFYNLTEGFPKQITDKIKESLPKLIASLKDETSGNKKQRMERAESLVSILSNIQASTDEFKEIIDFTINSMKTIEKESEIYYISPIILASKKQCDEQTFEIIFSIIKDFVYKFTSCNELNSVLYTIMAFTDDKNIDLSDLILDIINGKINFLGGFPIYTYQSDDTKIFDFISTFIMKCSNKSVDILKLYIEYLQYVSFSLLPIYLQTITNCLYNIAIDEEYIHKLYDSLIYFLDNLLVESENETIYLCIEILSKICKHKYAFIDVQKLFLIMNQLILTTFDGDDNESISQIISFVFELFTIYLDIEVNEDLINSLLKKLPIPVTVESGMEKVLNLIIVLLNYKRFEKFHFQFILQIANILTLTNIEIEKYKLSKELIKELEKTLKSELKKDSKLEKQLTMKFRSQRSKLNRLSKLLKQ